MLRMGMALHHDEAAPRKAGQVGRAAGEVVSELRGWPMGVPRSERTGIVIMPFRHGHPLSAELLDQLQVINQPGDTNLGKLEKMGI